LVITVDARYVKHDWSATNARPYLSREFSLLRIDVPYAAACHAGVTIIQFRGFGCTRHGRVPAPRIYQYDGITLIPASPETLAAA